MAAAFFVYSMNETRVTLTNTQNSHTDHATREMSYSQFNEILLCRDYLLSEQLFFSISDLSSLYMLGLENLNLMCAVVSRKISRDLLAHTQRRLLFLQHHINYPRRRSYQNVENPQLFSFILCVLGHSQFSV